MAVVEEFDYLCRLCATKTGILMGLPIFEAGEQMRNIDKKIAACLPVQVSLTDQLPKVVCEECAFKLDQLFDFREKCLHTEGMFMEMLKEIKEEAVHISEHHLTRVNNIGTVRRNLNNIQINNEDVQSHSAIPHETVEPTMHTMQVIDEMDLAGGEQVVTQEEIGQQDTDIQVAGIDCLDGDTVRMVDEHIREVSTDNFGSSQTDAEAEIEESCMNEDEIREHVDSKFVNALPSTSQINDISCEIMVKYTKESKHALLESALNNPTMDETGSHWYMCPFCNEAALETTSLATHFEQHFCRCCCDSYFTSVEMLNLHKEQCIVYKDKLVDKKKKDIQLNIATPSREKSGNQEEQKKQSPTAKRKWTAKTCDECGKQYRTNYKLQEHMRKHTGEKPFQCTTCEKAFRSKIGLAQHTATHTGQFDYNCSTCGKGFQCKSYLIVHQRVHSDEKPYPCNTCGQNFKTKQSLLDHENRHLGVKPYMCEICGRGFITKGLCKSHQKIHSGTDNRQYPCAVCNKMFVSKSYLNTHLRIHTGEKPYLCEVCGKGFLTRVDLKIHSTMHTGEKSFKCEMCGKVFARRAALRCHRRSHTGERPYRCDVCNKTFTQFSPMAIHKRLHTGERPYKCDACGKGFVSRSTMMCHRKKHHDTTTAVQKDVPTNEDGEIKIILSSDIMVRDSHDGIQISVD
ncbi:hypothetical protein ACFW04_001445 [Cataglyphis niger]